MSTIDVMPTIANLFDLNINYDFVFGHDAFRTGTQVVRFADGSFVSKDFRYDSLSETISITNDTITEGYLYTLNNQFLNDYLYNILILEYDYYKEDEEKKSG